MKTLWLDEEIIYDGSQLKSLFAYLKFGVLGDSVLAWVGPCQISNEHMLDGEDLNAGAEIRGSKMLHFIFEIFECELRTGVFLQRLFASLCRDLLEDTAKVRLLREGDDLYWQQKKLSISIAAKSIHSVLVHFAVNVENSGTPVPTCALGDWGVDPKIFAGELMSRMALEFESIKMATYKVRPAGSL